MHASRSTKEARDLVRSNSGEIYRRSVVRTTVPSITMTDFLGRWYTDSKLKLLEKSPALGGIIVRKLSFEIFKSRSNPEMHQVSLRTLTWFKSLSKLQLSPKNDS